MKIISLFKKSQTEVVEKLLRHCGLLKEAALRQPPVESRIAELELSYDYSYFDRICI